MPVRRSTARRAEGAEVALRAPARRIALAAGAALLLTAASPAQPGLAASAVSSAPDRPDLLLITVDTLRPDALGWIGGGDHTPALDRLARQGFRFPAAVSPVPLTLPAHTSLMTGLVPRRHGVRDNGQIVPAQGVSILAERLRRNGYATGAFVSGFPLLARFGLDRGFERYDDSLPEGPEGWVERAGPRTVEAALAWVAEAPRPWFLWVHLYEPHDPYEPPREFWRPGRRGLYDGEVALADHAVGELLAGLGEAATGGRLTVMTADHAESLGEHGEQAHGFFLYDTTMVVPLVFHWPGRLAPGQSAAAARLVDVAPTILDLLGQPGLAEVDGVSLRATLAPVKGEPVQRIPPAYLETLHPWIAYGWSPLAAIRHDGWKLISAPRPELYALAADPGESANRVDGERRRARELQAHLRAVEAAEPASSAGSDDPEVMAQLRALGYLGSGAATRVPPAGGGGLDDPKDRLRERNLAIAAEVKLRAGDTAAAIAAFAELLRADPDNRFAVLRSGIALLKAGEAARALPFLERSVALDPEQAEARYALADALTRLGRWERAAAEWMETVRLQPRRVAAWSNLGTALGRRGEIARAVEAFTHAVELEPDNPRLLGNLGVAERAAGRPQQALTHLERAAELWPGEGFPYARELAELLTAADRGDEARRGLGDGS